MSGLIFAARIGALVGAIACLSRAECVTHDWRDVAAGICSAIFYVLLGSAISLKNRERV